ncbi:MAG TPA: hybrid sensor histidine kinase/response regulator [Gemmatimonadales bacterium]|jgi:signal transduction histidine kinase
MTVPTEPVRHRGRVLVVDDQEPNRQLLHDMLEIDGHDVVEAADGLTALALAAARDPDVILLDVSMPGLDGFEVCEQLRRSPVTAATPVLLITALDQRENRIKGVAAGANDYLVKPIDRDEVSLRVRNAIRMRAMHRTVEQQYQALQRLERMRDDLVVMVAHDLRSPLTGLRGFLELMQEDVGHELAPAYVEMLTESIRSVDQLNGMIGDMLDVSRMEADALPINRRPLDLRQVAVEALAALGPQPSFHRIPVAIGGDPAEVSADGPLLQRVLTNLMTNAMRFSPRGAEVRVVVAEEDGGGTIRIRDRGPGIPEGEQARIFDKFIQVGDSRATRARSSGLGLTFCRMVVERHQGRIGVSSAVGTGSEFWLWLPASERP